MGTKEEVVLLCGCGGFPQAGVLCGYVLFSLSQCTAGDSVACPFKQTTPKVSGGKSAHTKDFDIEESIKSMNKMMATETPRKKTLADFVLSPEFQEIRHAFNLDVDIIIMKHQSCGPSLMQGQKGQNGEIVQVTIREAKSEDEKRDDIVDSIRYEGMKDPSWVDRIPYFAKFGRKS